MTGCWTSGALERGDRRLRRRWQGIACHHFRFHKSDDGIYGEAMHVRSSEGLSSDVGVGNAGEQHVSRHLSGVVGGGSGVA